MSANINELVHRIKNIASNEPGDITSGPRSRYALLQASKDLTAALEPPDQVVARVAFSGYYYTCVRLAIDLGILDQLATSKEPLTAKQLATQKNADESLVLRIARTLVGMGFAADAQTADGSNAFTSTNVTKQATIPSAKAGLKFHFDQCLPTLPQAPSFFAQNSYKSPRGASDGLFQHAHNTTSDCYTYWSAQDPQVMANFNTFMQGYFGSPPMQMPINWFPYDSVVLNGFDPSISPYLWVDIGGGKGHHVQEIVSKYPSAQGTFILQDLPNVISDISTTTSTLHPKIQTQPYDFFQPQPITHARGYCLENVLHNWNDSVCLKILANVREAMKPGYSKLIISGMVIRDREVPLLQSGLDATMLFVHSGGQRSREQWCKLLGEAGFRVLEVWMSPGVGNGIVEAEVVG